MPEVQSLTGPIDVDQLGTVLMHEHIFTLTPEMQTAYPGFGGWDPDKYVAEAQQTLKALKARGVDTIVDLTVVGTGRDVTLIQRAVEGTGLQVIVATGIYTYDAVPKPFHFVGPGTILGGDDERMIQLFVDDIEQGIQGTGVKAGILKCAVDEPGMTHGVERVLRAVAQAHRRTGVPISTHTHAETKRGLEQQKVFSEEGVDLSRVIIGHSGDTTDLDYLEELIAAGSKIGMDRFGIDVELPFEERVATVATLCERGHAGSMVLSHDTGVFMDFLPWEMVPEVLPRWHYQHIHDDVLPALLERGVTQDQIDQMLIHNPREFFTTQGSY
jgi:phosphotriesterase-related protein